MDPLLIFGPGPFPRWGIAGAAVATVISRAFALLLSTYILVFREKMLTISLKPFHEVIDSWKSILYIAVPAAGTRILSPVAIGIITHLIAVYGTGPVAAFGVATRIEFFVVAPQYSQKAVMTAPG